MSIQPVTQACKLDQFWLGCLCRLNTPWQCLYLATSSWITSLWSSLSSVHTAQIYTHSHLRSWLLRPLPFWTWQTPSCPFSSSNSIKSTFTKVIFLLCYSDQSSHSAAFPLPNILCSLLPPLTQHGATNHLFWTTSDASPSFSWDCSIDTSLFSPMPFLRHEVNFPWNLHDTIFSSFTTHLKNSPLWQCLQNSTITHLFDVLWLLLYYTNHHRHCFLVLWPITFVIYLPILSCYMSIFLSVRAMPRKLKS